MNMIKPEKVMKIDFDEFMKTLKVSSKDIFISYLKDIYNDLLQRSDDKMKGINKLTFLKYYELPGIIGLRLFTVFDKNKNEYIDKDEFINGMINIFCDKLNQLERFIFNFYDFDNDNYITREDVSVIFGYIPLNNKGKDNGLIKLKYELDDYKDRVESQDEIYKILNRCFEGLDKIDYNQFVYLIENVNSDVFIYILIFLFENKPFSMKTLDQYRNFGENKSFRDSEFLDINKTLIACPDVRNKFAPSISIGKSSLMKNISDKELTKEYKNNFAKNISSKSYENKNILNKKISNNNKKIEDDKKEVEGYTNDVKFIRNNNINKNFDEFRKLKNVRQDKTSGKITNEGYNEDPNMKNFCDSFSNNNTVEDFEELAFEGYLYKVTHTKKIKKLWFKLIGSDIYYYKRKEDDRHKGMHSLTGIYVQEGQESRIDNKDFFCFSLIYPKKIRKYFCDNELEYMEWIRCIKIATGFFKLEDFYDIKDKLGNGKFGLIRLGIHKETGRKVAVKIISKIEMTIQDLELVKTEIEIMKISQHPNIIRLYDLFETYNLIYLIMEYCPGGDLFSYIEKRGFRLSEHRAATICHKLATTIYYLHCYGIVHRDIKPENILMTDGSEDADLKLIDFGLSKILGPNETCKDPFGTVSYIAPEILLEKPYTKAVDIWSLGIFTYLLLSGFLPFDDEQDEKEIAMQTVNDQVPFPNQIWKKLTREVKLFVDSLLLKDPLKRPSIKQVLEHEWFKKFFKNKNTEKRGSKDYKGSIFKIYTTINEEDLFVLNKHF